MPTAAAPPCRIPTCPERMPCPVHGGNSRQEYLRRQRDTPWQRLYKTKRWERLSRRHLLAHPLCVDCLAEGHRRLGQHADHVRPHRGDPALFWSPANLQTLCVSHHSRKTAAEQRGRR